jgi:ParB family chromosome partitioning protein
MVERDIDAIRRVLVDGLHQKSVAAELELSEVAVRAMTLRAWNKHVESRTRPPCQESVNAMPSPDTADLIKEMPLQVLEHEKAASDQCPAENATISCGRAPEMPLADILFDDKLHRENILQWPRFVQDVRKRGIKSPISLRPHSTLHGKWTINDGHRRFKAAQAVGLSSIPYFVDVNFDIDDRVNVNLYRSRLSPWAWANFIAQRMAEGDSKGQIARGLGRAQTFVTEHLALVDAPPCLHLAYAKGVKSARTLYDLRRAHDEFPTQIEDWCANASKITRDTLQELLEKLRRDVKTPAAEVERRGAP